MFELRNDKLVNELVERAAVPSVRVDALKCALLTDCALNSDPFMMDMLPSLNVALKSCDDCEIRALRVDRPVKDEKRITAKPSVNVVPRMEVVLMEAKPERAAA